MINNFDLIRSYLKFENSGDFYFIQLISRRKDNPELDSGDDNHDGDNDDDGNIRTDDNDDYWGYPGHCDGVGAYFDYNYEDLEIPESIVNRILKGE